MTKRKDLTDIIALYEEILSGSRSRMPKYTWAPMYGGFDNYKRVLRYLVLEKLRLTRGKVLKQYGVYKIYTAYPNVRIYDVLAKAYPEYNFQPSEFKWGR